MDLGLAMLGDASRTLTRDQSSLLGTLRYMPPEQLQRNLVEVDHRADVYALGATFYELLAQRPMFDGEGEARLIHQLLYDEPPAPREVAPDMPSDLATIVQKATRKDPRERYASAAALAADLDAFLAGRPIGARPPTLGYVMALAVRRHRVLTAAIVASVLLGAVGVWQYVERERNLRAAAEEARSRAELAEATALAREAELLEQQGRLELAAGEPARAAVFLAEAYRRSPRSASVRMLLSEALRDGVTPSLLLRGHSGAVTAVAFSPGGARALSASEDRTLRIWHSYTGAELARIDLAGEPIVAAFAGPDAVVAQDRQGRVHRYGLVPRVSPDPAIAVAGTVVAISPDGDRMLVDHGSSRAALWSLSEQRELTALSYGDAPEDLACDDGDDSSAWYRAVDDKTERMDGAVWACAQRQTRWSRGAYWRSRRGRQLLADSEELKAYGDGSLVVLEQDGARRATFRGHTDLVLAGAFGSDGRLMTGAADGTVRIWRRPEQRNIDLIAALGSGTTATASPDGRLIVAGSLHSPERGELVNETHDCPGGSGVRGDDAETRFSADGSRFVAVAAGAARVCGSDSGKLVARLEQPGQRVASLDRDGKRAVTGGEDGFAQLWDIAATKKEAALGPHPGSIVDASFSPDGARVVTVAGRQAKLWDSKTGTLLASLEEHGGALNGALFSPDGRHLLTTSNDRTARMWLTDQPRAAPVVLREHADAVVSAGFDTKGETAITCGYDNRANIWSVADGVLVATLVGHRGPVLRCLLAPDNARAFTASTDAEATRLVSEHVPFRLESGRLVRFRAQ